MKRIRKGDDVIVTAGRSRGQRGTILRVLDGDRVVVENANMVKKHVKPDPSKGRTGGIVSQEASIHASNVMLYNPATGQGDRIGFKILEDGRKVRYYRSNGEVLDS